jgi:hypothetical protein
MINIPFEYSYTHNSVENSNTRRDKELKNRYWFDFPPEWRTSEMREYIIGFRSLWISKPKRLLCFDINLFNKATTKTTEIPLIIELDYNEDLSKISYILSETLIANNLSPYTISFYSFPSIHPKSNIMYNPDPTQTKLIPAEGENWTMQLIAKIDELKNGNEDEKSYGGNFISIGDYTINITNMNEDAKNLFNVTDDYPSDEIMKTIITANSITFSNIWDRHSCMLKSNIVPANGYLAYTNSHYTPIRYYKITNSMQSFYIDLWNGHYHNVKTILEKNDEDQISLEIMLLRNANSLYT